MAQMVLDFPHKADYSAASFLPTQGSEAARNLLQNFERGVLCLWGAPGSGKTHLLQTWASRMGAMQSLDGAGNFLAIDDVDKLDAGAQQKLFFWLNRVGRNGALVVASRQPVVGMQNMLPDVRSRLSAGQAVEVLPPSEGELGQVAGKWAADRQLVLGPGVLEFILARAERSVPALRDLVERLDRLSLAEKRGITVPLARKVISDSL